MITKQELLDYLAKLPDNAVLTFTDVSYYPAILDWDLSEKPNEENQYVICTVDSRP